MELNKFFNDLESNQPHECEETKKKLLELCSQTKEQWMVHCMMDYFLKTSSARILEVLVKVQAPHDVFIFERLDDWLKTQMYRNQALNVFCFVVRRHPTWLYKIEKHRLIKSVFKLLSHEKEIVPLMGALLGIITLLPIIPNSVTNFLNDLFEVFGNLASWKWQNTNKIPDDKLVHLQLGLQMLFHRLYGMYPCNFLAYLTDFIKKDKGGGIFQHTIRPLLETVRVHPMLVTGTPETEIVNIRWKEMEPHDIVMECAQLSLPVVNSDYSNDYSSSTYPVTPISMFCSPINVNHMTSSTTSNNSYNYQFKDLQQTRGPIARFEISDINATFIWSPHNEITTAGSIPLTPTPPYIMAASSSAQLLSVTGSSPPEAAVEATPETTPMKDIREVKITGPTPKSNPHAVRAILMTSQPPSPMRKERAQFHFPEINTSDDIATISNTNTERQPFADHVINTYYDTQIPTTYDRRLKQIIQDRVEIEALTGKRDDIRSPTYSTGTPDIDLEQKKESQLVRCTPSMTAHMQTSLVNKHVEHVSAICGDCNETERNMCSSGGLHMPTSQSMQRLAKVINRRNRMASYCEKNDLPISRKHGSSFCDKSELTVRRTKSCSSLYSATGATLNTYEKNRQTQKNGVTGLDQSHIQKPGVGRLQKSNKMLAIATAKKELGDSIDCVNAATQTLETVPQHYECLLFDMLTECKELRNNYACNLKYPQDVLDQYITRSVLGRESGDLQGQYQLLWLQLQYERYRRGIHAERNRRLMGRSRDKRSLEMERDRLCEQLKSFDMRNISLEKEMDKAIKLSNKSAQNYNDQLAELKSKLQHEIDQRKCLQQANEDLETRLNVELSYRKEVNYELESLRGQIFSLNTELQHVNQQAEKGEQCKQELERLEAEFIVMGEVQVRCRDRLADVSNFRARDEELQMLQESYNMELKELRHNLEDRTCQLDSTKHKVVELQAQLVNCEKVITEQKRLLRTVKDEYEEMFKALSKKYEVQKNITLQLEEKIVMSQQKPPVAVGQNTCSPDTDKTDIASSMDRNSPLSTSLASSESLSASLRSTELKNLHHLVETQPIPAVSVSAHNMGDNRMSSVDLASSANTANTIDVMQSLGQLLDLPSTSTSHHPHVHLQQQHQEKHEQQ